MTELLFFILGAVAVAALMLLQRRRTPEAQSAPSDTMDDYLESLVSMQDTQEKRSAMREFVRAQMGVDPDQGAEPPSNVVQLRPAPPVYAPDAFAINNFANVCRKMGLKLRQDNATDPDSA
jgi:hypothetical protein